MTDSLCTGVEEIAAYLPRLDLLWFDTPERITPDLARPFVTAIRKHKPECLMNGRIDNQAELADFLEAADHSALETDRPWESPDTIGSYWGYHKDDRNWKSPEAIVARFRKINKAGGNYLLNVSPDRNGEIPEEPNRILKEVGIRLRG